MSILDDAIREHLELKRAHGADETEIKKLEDEAFGPPQRPDEPDPLAEAPTEFLVAPRGRRGGRGRRGRAAGASPTSPTCRRRPSRRSPRSPARRGAAGQAEEPDDGPAEEEHPAMEHEAIADPGPTTEERARDRRPADRDVRRREPVRGGAGGGRQRPPTRSWSTPSAAEPRLAPVDPLPASRPPDEPEADEDDDDDFFSEQRLSDELNQALEAPLPDEPGAAPPTRGGPVRHRRRRRAEEESGRARSSSSAEDSEEHGGARAAAFA